MKLIQWCCTVFLLVPIGIAANSEEMQRREIMREIEQYRSRIDNIDMEIADTESRIKDDSASFISYTARIDSVRNLRSTRIDSLTEEIQKEKVRKDSLTAHTGSLARRIRSYRYREQQFSSHLMASMERYHDSLSLLPPSIAESPMRDLTMLKQDVDDGSAAPGEAVDRLWLILNRFSTGRFSIDSWSAPSAYEGIDGSAHYLRVGYAFLACVDAAGKRGAYWSPRKMSWVSFEDAGYAETILRAIQMREDRDIPDIIPLPIPYISTLEEGVSHE
ncbi:DUF3450 family protein [Chitinivibrio alkaliphilus]|nr:DUF3450 family protein [Chitinivibrio alkaliphilus]